MRFWRPTYGARELEGLGGCGEAGAVDGVWVQAIVPLSQDRIPVDGHPRGSERILHCALHCVVVDAGDDGGGWVLHQVDVGAPHTQVQERLHRGVCVNCVPIDDDIPYRRGQMLTYIV